MCLVEHARWEELGVGLAHGAQLVHLIRDPVEVGWHAGTCNSTKGHAHAIAPRGTPARRRTCMRATQRLVQMMGASGLTDDNPVQRHFRDVQGMATQIGVAFDVNMPPWGRWALGLDPGPGLHGSEKLRV